MRLRYTTFSTAWSLGSMVLALVYLRIPLHRANLYYWSDMDEDGYNLLSMFRTLYPHAKSIFMDETCFDLHEPEAERQPEKYKRQAPIHLTNTEVNTYNRLMSLQGRIEQEKLKLSYVMDIISVM